MSRDVTRAGIGWGFRILVKGKDVEGPSAERSGKYGSDVLYGHCGNKYAIKLWNRLQ
jgi:hypothetical protein